MDDVRLRLDMRISPDDRRRLAALAELTQRKESDVMRLLIRSARPVDCGGIALSSAPPAVPSPTTTPHAARTGDVA